jgi:hypothetical protein
MRRTILLCAVLAIACAKAADNAANDSAAMPAESVTPPPPTPITLAEVAGTWEGTVTAPGNDTVLATHVLNATADTTGWTLTLANAKTPTKTKVVKLTKVVAAGDSIEVETAPFESVLRAGQQVTVHTIYRLKDGKLVGSVHAMYPNNEMVMMQATATKKM